MMKKLLGIVFLSLLWCGNLYAVSQDDIINQHLKNRKLDNIEGIWIHNGGKISGIYKSGNSYVSIVIKSSDLRNGSRDLDLSKGSDTVFYGTAYASVGSASINIKVSGDSMSYSGDFKGQTYSGSANRIWPSNIQNHNAKFKSKKDIEDEDKRLAVIINNAKKTCSVLGFESGSEKFADCTLKLYTQKVDEIVAEKQLRQQQVSSSSSTNQSSSSNVTTIYDPVRDSNALMNKGMKMLGGKCTLGVDC